MYLSSITDMLFYLSMLLFMRDGDEHPTSRASQKKAKLEELSNNISDRSEAEGNGCIVGFAIRWMAQARQLVANPQYTIIINLLLTYFGANFPKIFFAQCSVEGRVFENFQKKYFQNSKNAQKCSQKYPNMF